MRYVQTDALEPSFKIFARVGHIQRMLFEQWSVLETLTPNEYLEFRGALGQASGFQSHQYRALEFLLGNKDPALHRAPSATCPESTRSWSSIWTRPVSMTSSCATWRARATPSPRIASQRDWRQPYEKSAGVVEVFRLIYEDPEQHWDAYEMCEKLVDVEERFQLWRYRHMMTVMRIIGFKPGTGGSSGVGFLRKALELRFFPELWDVRTELTPPAPR